MQLAKVLGNVVASQKAPSLAGIKLMIVQKIGQSGQALGEPMIAVDATGQVGEGELVLLEGGREAAMALEDTFNPADQAILAVVDRVDSLAGQLP
ncbi:MAG: EutN/CcmL family microcompartment protein [Candidatus Sericytochromatia bacterium]|nr:EutN/CcmL family microcompartment protein [Candidatus Sericytochromatia bacterium]